MTAWVASIKARRVDDKTEFGVSVTAVQRNVGQEVYSSESSTSSLSLHQSSAGHSLQRVC